MAKHSVQRKRKKNGNSFSFGRAVVLVLCFIGVSFGLYLWQAAFSIGQPTPTVDDDDFRPTIGEPPYRIVIDAGHGGSDPGARGVVQESEMTAATAEALSAWLERDPNYIPLTIRESYNSPGKLLCKIIALLMVCSSRNSRITFKPGCAGAFGC